MEKKTEMTALDIKFIIPELKQKLLGGKFQKIYQYSKKQFLFEIYKQEIGRSVLYVDKNKIFLTSKKKPAPSEPPSFCMFLRKYLLGKIITDIKQRDFDRIVEFHTQDCILIFELFHPGNVVLCDSMRNIIMPLEVQRWRDREVKPRNPYKYPPAQPDPEKMDFSSFLRMIRSSKKSIGSFLVGLGFGPVYADEICYEAGIDKLMPAESIDSIKAANLHEVMKKFLRRNPKPCIYQNFVSPFPLRLLGEPMKCFEDFSSALDEYFSIINLEIEKKEMEEREKKEVEKAEKIMEERHKAEQKWLRMEKEARKAAEAIYRNYDLVAAIVSGIQKAKKAGLTWAQIKEKIKSEDTPEAHAIKEIREGDAVVVVELDGMDVEIDFRMSVEKNAEKYFEEAKWAKKKLERLKVLPKPEIKKVEEKIEKKPKRKKWYERFKWFITSDGFLVVAGRNAEQNEELLNKHVNQNDFVFHADIQGAAFVAIISEGKKVPDTAKKEAAEFAAANSKAWAKGLGKIDIYCVKRSQLSKTGGLPKGSFLVLGEREWYRDLELKLSVGVKIENESARVIAGPVMAVRKHSDYFVTIKPGFTRSSELARIVKNKIMIKAKPEDKVLIERIALEEFEKVIPAGMGDVVEWA